MEQGNINPVDIQRYLGGISYPASKDDIVDYAREKGASDEVIDFMDRLPDREYQSPADVSHASGELMSE